MITGELVRLEGERNPYRIVIWEDARVIAQIDVRTEIEGEAMLKAILAAAENIWFSSNIKVARD